MKREISKLLKAEMKTTVAYTSRKLSTYFIIKHKSKFNHQHDLVWYAECLSGLCHEDNIHERGRISEPMMDYNGTDLKSYMLKRSVESGQKTVSKKDFEVLGKNCKKNTWKRKITGLLLIKQIRPTLNTHYKSVPLK